MLVLSRKLGEAIIIGDHIRVTVVEIRAGHVGLGIVAPRDVSVDRQEIHERRHGFVSDQADEETTETVVLPPR